MVRASTNSWRDRYILLAYPMPIGPGQRGVLSRDLARLR